MWGFLLRVILSILSLFIISRLVGARQIAQLTFYDYVVGITIGSIAATMAVDDSVPFYYPIIAMALYGLFTVLVAFLTSKSIVLRRLLTGKPTVMIHNGKIIASALRKHHYDINDLLLECRIQGYFNIADIQSAVMETNGEISILPKATKRPVTPADLNLVPQPAGLQYNLIIDGNILEKNLRAYGKDLQWLKGQLKLQNVQSEREVLLATGNPDNTVSVFLKDEELNNQNFFM